jgi:uncharacterized RDD family membrane protein YckC
MRGAPGRARATICDPKMEHREHETVLALDNLPLALPIAGVGPRLIAGAVDYAVVSLLALALLVAGLFVVAALPTRAAWVFAVMILGFFLIEYGYFAAFESLTHGQTLGKKALRLRVVAGDGARASTMSILVRNGVRSLDMVVGALLMVLDPLSRRLGDRLAGTLVVHELEMKACLTVGRVPRGWSARDVAVVESFFRRAAELELARADSLARKLLAAVERDDPALLAGVEGLEPVERLRRALLVESA